MLSQLSHDQPRSIEGMEIFGSTGSPQTPQRRQRDGRVGLRVRFPLLHLVLRVESEIDTHAPVPVCVKRVRHRVWILL